MDIPSPPPPHHHHQATITSTPPPPPPTTTPTSPTTTNLDPDLKIQQIPKQHPPPFTNGVLKRHKPRHHHNLNNLSPPVVISYKECLKNHAASMGGHAVDGCGEFMPSPTSTPTDPTSLKCAACGCHRNFHRRDPDEMFHTTAYLPSSQHVIEYQPHHRHHPPPPQAPPPVQPISIGGVRGSSLSPADSPSPPPISSSYYPSAPHMLLALSSAPPENTHTHTQSLTHNNALISGVIGSNSNGKKRFRTKFTQDQKQKMHELAERVGWKMQKKDEDIIIGCCSEIGVQKGVFKVWMHNNKMTLGNKKESGNDNGSSGGGGGGGGIDFLANHQHQHQPPLHINIDSVSSGGGVGGNVIGTNGSSSSS